MYALHQKDIYTVDDICNLPDGERAELIDGKIYFMSAPGLMHQRILGYLYRKIADYIDAQGGSCESFMAPFAVFLSADSKNYVEPDLSVVCDPKKLTDKGCMGAPDWIVEIASPSSRSMDYYKKLFKYRMSGVREYWVVDPDSQVVTVYDFEHDNMKEYNFGEHVPSGIWPEFSVKV